MRIVHALRALRAITGRELTKFTQQYGRLVSALVRAGPNEIRIEAANLAVNHMAGRALPDYKLLNLRYGTRFEPQDMDKVQPVTAGLFGPIRLVAMPAAPRAASTR